MSLRVIPILLLCGLLGALVPASAASLLDDYVINRPSQRTLFRTYEFKVHVISNLPYDTVMPAVCRDTLINWPGHCDYLPLANVGAGNNLLPYYWRKNHEIVVVVDQATLTPADAAGLQRLKQGIFPLVKKPKTTNAVSVSIQNVGDKGFEYQLLVEIPEARWLEETLDDLWKLPCGVVPDKSRMNYTYVKELERVALLSNDQDAVKAIDEALSFCDFTAYDLREVDAFLKDTDVTRRILTINWNAAQELNAKTAARVLPDELRAECDKVKPDKMGLTGWQRFNRQAILRYYPKSTPPTWVAAAPTSAYLAQITAQLAKNSLTNNAESTLPLCDLTFIRSLAVGVYLPNYNKVERPRFVMQQQLETLASSELKGKITTLVSVNDWEKVLREVLDRQPLPYDPTGRPGAVPVVHEAFNADAMLLLDARLFTPSVEYDIKQARVTAAFAKFTKTEPTEPPMPDPDAKNADGAWRYLGKTHEERVLTREYQKSLMVWENDDMPRYRKQLRDYQDAKTQWETDRDRYPVSYEYTVYATPKVRLDGMLRIVDYVETQRIIWTSPVTYQGGGEKRLLAKYAQTVYGDATVPRQPDELAIYRDSTDWADTIAALGPDHAYLLGQQAIYESMRTGLTSLRAVTLWDNDLQPWSKAKAPKQ